MSHDHPHQHDDHHHGHGNIQTAFWINLVFTVIEVIGGLYTNSIAILSDAVHDLGDSVALLFSLLMEKVSQKKGNAYLTYGYRRYSLLGAFISSIILIVGSTFVLYHAIYRLRNIQEVNETGMLLMSLLGILFNGVAVLRLKKDQSLNSRVVFMHLLEDVLGWLSILIVSAVMHFVDLPILDPVLSIVIAIFILSRIIPTIMKVGRIFMQYKPDDMEIVKIKEKMESFEEILNIHDIHLWSLDGSHHIFSCHVLFHEDIPLERILQCNQTIRQQLQEMGIYHCTLETETGSADCEPCDEGVYP